MSKQTWTIGSDASCDLVVTSQTVSGQHCRLTRDGEELSLEDLDSTNGTFVNGEPLNGSRAVIPTDTITLGQTHPMPWPESIHPRSPASTPRTNSGSPQNSQCVITLGRGADNSVVLSGSNVSTQHARLIIEGQRIFVEDLGSTNGTAVSKAENKISRAEVKKDDTIFLGSSAFQVADLIRRSQAGLVAPAIPGSGSSITHARKSSQRHSLLPWLIGAASVALIVSLGWYATRGASVATSELAVPATAESATGKSTGFQATVMKAESEPQQPSTEPNVDGDDFQSSVSAEPASPSPLGTLDRSLFLIVCADGDRKTSFRVGTAFAIDSDHLATAATVVQAVENLKQNGFSQVYLYSPATDKEFAMGSIKMHPRFELASQAADEARKEHDEIYDQLEQEPPTPEAFEKVKPRLINARVRAIEAMDLKATYDLALIESLQPLSHWLSSADPGTTLRPNQKLSVTGYAFDVEDPYLDRNLRFDSMTVGGRVGQLVRATAESANRLIGKGITQHHEYAFLGSPVMNDQGRVVGIYSRPTPPLPDANINRDEMFDATLFELVREIQ